MAQLDSTLPANRRGSHSARRCCSNRTQTQLEPCALSDFAARLHISPSWRRQIAACFPFAAGIRLGVTCLVLRYSCCSLARPTPSRARHLQLAPSTAADLARLIRESGMDPAECYRVRDLSFVKDDIKLYLNDGYLIFSKPVLGQRLSALFTTDVEGGDGEVIVIPPTRSERQSLAAFTQSPNLDEHVTTILMILTDDSMEGAADCARAAAGLGQKSARGGRAAGRALGSGCRQHLRAHANASGGGPVVGAARKNRLGLFRD